MSTSAIPYIKSLDGLRGVAILLVIFRHWHMPNLYIEFGWIGVNLFFVLSGFLITSILLLSKSSNIWDYLKVFYQKRALRIFPIYYIYIAITFLFFTWYASSNNDLFSHKQLDRASDEIHQNIFLFISYTYNFHNIIAYLGEMIGTGTKFYGHIWSLALEEQFYLFFPFIVYFLDKKWLKIFLIVIIVSSPIIRILAAEYLKTTGSGNFWDVGLIITKTTFFQLDSLACGALLAAIDWKSLTISNRNLYLGCIIILGINLLTIYLLKDLGVTISWKSMGWDIAAKQMTYNTGYTLLDIRYGWMFSLLNILFLMILILCLRDSFICRIFRNQSLVGMGKISYGIYLYHNPLFVIFTGALSALGLSYPSFSLPAELLAFLAYILIVVSISRLSYVFIEKPLLEIKDRINYSFSVLGKKI